MTPRLRDLSVQALTHLAADPDLLGRFLTESGMAPHDLRAAADDPGLLQALLDFLCAEDARLLAFAGDAGMPAAEIAKIRLMLEAGQMPR